MRRILLIFFLLLSVGCLAAREIVVLEVNGTINPLISAYIEKGIKEAKSIRAECLIIFLDTPGGLDISMRTIIKAILSSDVPVVVYVYPSGARAASAGAFIGISANILAMAPGTNIGAARPIDLSGKISDALSEKITNDASAYIKSLSEKRGRNSEWAEKAVRESKSITENEAVKLNIADFIAKNLSDLLKKLNGIKVTGDFGTKIINTEDAHIQKINLKFHQKFLHSISDPNVAYILLMIGFYGIIYELASPGAIFPGVIGAICLLLAFFALESLPINIVGIFLILLGIGLFIAELKTPGFGALFTGAIISLFLGSLMLFSTSSPYFRPRVGIHLIMIFVAFSAFFFLFALSSGIKALRAKPISGKEYLIGKIGYVKEKLEPTGIVLVEGEDWTAESINGMIEQCEKIIVLEIEGLKLKVKKY